MRRIGWKFGPLTALAVLSIGAPAFAQSLPITVYKDPVTGATVTTMEIPPPLPANDPSGRPISAAPQRPTPSSRGAWVPGHYSWNPNLHGYAWVDGRYMQPPPGRAHWTPGRWDLQAAGWVWVPSRWD